MKKAIDSELPTLISMPVAARLAICVPCRDMVHTVFSYNLNLLLKHNFEQRLETNVHYHSGTLVVNQREALAKIAMSDNATHILWLDSDMSFPPSTATQLLAHKQPIVAGNYVTRSKPYKTVAYKGLFKWESYLTHTKEDVAELTEVQGVGMGCMLTSVEVFKKLSKPWFNITYEAKTDDFLGEDMNFCIKARQNGFKILIDNKLSLKLHHLGTFAFSHDLIKPFKNN